eukprot:CAMPEP_0118885422 /NCGR_PEP_ID=MMETSP1163-20130328/23905_1 /TAXON_ID=124430 /ORGANISM="Phaeomonas parva, Strain CCMP2877" /LENGTH=58 /DNA_ID=CAMNT_0006823435 /DNA_START=15 /DNA_END=189 /DNA_ORIENTATION=-
MVFTIQRAVASFSLMGGGCASASTSAAEAMASDYLATHLGQGQRGDAEGKLESHRGGN